MEVLHDFTIFKTLYECDGFTKLYNKCQNSLILYDIIIISIYY